MREVRLLPPELRGREVHFRWQVTPASPLYERQHFRLRFPEAVELARVPDALWWWLMLLCLHPHWVLLRPCRVHIPVALGAGECGFWERLLVSYADTLESYRANAERDFDSRVEIVAAGAPLEPLERFEDTGRFAAAVSGGKDGLVQAGILRELSRDPLLVAVTSPLPGLEDHQTTRRRRVFDALAALPNARFIEVESDFRSTWDNTYSRGLGYPVSVNEITDTFLYSAVTIAVGVACGASGFFLASENEVSENLEIGGRLVQHPHFMYGAVVQGALDRWLGRSGRGYGSLIASLHSAQVQELLTTRYSELSPLQYSCWRARGSGAACSRCSQCFRLALECLRCGGSPSDQGVNLAKAFASARWRPEWEERSSVNPRSLVGRRFHDQILRSMQMVEPKQVWGEILRGRPWELLRARGWRAIRRHRVLREAALTQPQITAPGYRADFASSIPESLRAGALQIFDEHFEREDPAGYSGALGRTRAAIAHIAAPLAP